MKTVRNLSFDEFGLSGEFYFKLFKSWIGLFIANRSTPEYAASCITMANGLNTALLNQLFVASNAYREHQLKISGNEVKRITTRKGLSQLIEPRRLIIPEPDRGKTPVAHFELNCRWELEHGMEWIIRGESLLYVGEFCGQNPFRKFSTADSSNFAFGHHT